MMTGHDTHETDEEETNMEQTISANPAQEKDIRKRIQMG